MGVGALAALVLLVRAYMGILLPLTLLWQIRTSTWQSIIRQGALVMLDFGLLYGGWPVRNYLLTLLPDTPQAAGSRVRQPDSLCE